METAAETAEAREKADKDILELNVIIVYKRLVQGLIYSPPDCDKYLALDVPSRRLTVLARLWSDYVKRHQRKTQ